MNLTVQELDRSNIEKDRLIKEILVKAEALFLDTQRINSAILLADSLHDGQTRHDTHNNGRTAYILHPLRNTLWLLTLGCYIEDIIISSILHDTVEDCLARFLAETNTPDALTYEVQVQAVYQLLEDRFSSLVSSIVKNVTNIPSNSSLSKEEKRKIYFIHVAYVIKDLYTFLVKLADFIDNAGSLIYDPTVTDPKIIRMKKHLAMKYLPLCELFMTNFHLNYSKFPLRENVFNDNDMDNVAFVTSRLSAIRHELQQIIAN